VAPVCRPPDRLEVSVDDRLLVRVLHPIAGLDEKFHPFADLQLLIAILSDR
jgi:hypothetical protein